MLKIKALAGAVAANTNIPFAIYTQTNNKARYNATDNTVSILEPTLWDIKSNIIFTPDTGGTVELQAYANELPIPDAKYSFTTAGTSPVTYNINDVLKVIPTTLNTNVKVAFRFNVAGTITSGDAVFEYRK